MATDTLGVLDAALALPEQCETALGETLKGWRSSNAAEITSVVVMGMGGSGVVGRVLRAVAEPTSTVPIVLSQSHTTPAFVDDRTLVIAVSFSGNTAETLESVAGAHAAGAQIITVASGGAMVEWAEQHGVANITVDASIPTPRSAFGAMAMPVLATFDRLGLCEPLGEQIDATIRQLKIRRDEFSAAGNAAERLARRIGRTLPLVYSSGGIGDAAASRWKSQFNENPKVAAFSSLMPELTHNEVCGWAQHGDMTRQVFSIVALRHDYEHPAVSAGFDLVSEVTEEVVAGIHDVHAGGDGAMAQTFDLMYFGDLVSINMALMEGLDPGPVPVLDQIKSRLASPVAL